jgi:hypothetical protein
LVAGARTHDECRDGNFPKSNVKSNRRVINQTAPCKLTVALTQLQRTPQSSYINIASIDTHTATMAPSRALLLRRLTSATVTPCLRPTTRLLTTSATTLRRIQQPSALQHDLWRQSQFSAPCTRLYSQSASAAPEAPDYLNEAELHVFNKIMAELEPVKLEVCSASPPSRLRRMHLGGDTSTSRR